MITATIQIATKELVDELLLQNSKNRNLREKVVALYESEIRSGNWILTNQGIGVCEDGQLADGQHRLMAIRNCGYPPVPLLVVRGLAEEVRLVVDQQAKRTVRDALFFSLGDRVSHHAPAICRALFHFASEGDSYESPSIHQIIDVLHKNMDTINTVVEAPRSNRMFAAASLAAFVSAINETGKVDEVVSFMRIVEDGENLNKKMPAYHLRNFIINNRDATGGGGVQKERYAKTLKATIAHLNGEEMGVLRS
jgi:hypothetical protein